MNPEELEKKAVGLYRELISGELSRPGFAEEKKAFLERFRPAPVWIPGFEFFVPAAALACLFIYFYALAPGINPLKALKHRPRPAVVQGVDTSVIRKDAPADPRKVPPQPRPTRHQIPQKTLFPRVIVKSATSSVGQPMVFQKKIDYKPITVIWVFIKPTGVPA